MAAAFPDPDTSNRVALIFDEHPPGFPEGATPYDGLADLVRPALDSALAFFRQSRVESPLRVRINAEHGTSYPDMDTNVGAVTSLARRLNRPDLLALLFTDPAQAALDELLIAEFNAAVAYEAEFYAQHGILNSVMQYGSGATKEIGHWIIAHEGHVQADFVFERSPLLAWTKRAAYSLHELAGIEALREGQPSESLELLHRAAVCQIESAEARDLETAALESPGLLSDHELCEIFLRGPAHAMFLPDALRQKGIAFTRFGVEGEMGPGANPLQRYERSLVMDESASRPMEYLLMTLFLLATDQRYPPEGLYDIAREKWSDWFDTIGRKARQLGDELKTRSLAWFQDART